MKQHSKKRKIRWGRVAILVMALVVSIAILSKIGFTIISYLTEESQSAWSVQVKDSQKIGGYFLVTVQEGDSLWTILEGLGFKQERIPDLIRKVEFVNTSKFGFRSPSDLVPGDKWIIPLR